MGDVDMANRNIADDATPLTLQPHDCLQFSVAKEDRWIELRLMERVVPRQFEYIHIRKASEYVREEEWNTSPRHFSLFGRVRGEQWRHLAVEEDKLMQVEDDRIMLEFKEQQKGI